MSSSTSSPLEHEAYMKQAIETACQNLQRPFGALLVDHVEGEVISSAVNRSYRNPVAHSELEAINEAVRKSGGDVNWGNCTLYVTSEPCPMCMSGILWTGIARVVYGSSIQSLKAMGYRNIDLNAAQVIARAEEGLACDLVGGILEAECDALFAAAIKLDKKSR